MNIQPIKYVSISPHEMYFFFSFLQSSQQHNTSSTTVITEHYNPLTNTITRTTASGSFPSNDLFSSSTNKRKMTESDDEDDNYDM